MILALKIDQFNRIKKEATMRPQCFAQIKPEAGGHGQGGQNRVVLEGLGQAGKLHAIDFLSRYGGCTGKGVPHRQSDQPLAQLVSEDSN